MLSCTGYRCVCVLPLLVGLPLFAQQNDSKGGAANKAVEEKMIYGEAKADEAPPGVIPRQPAITSMYPQDARPGQTVEFSVRGEFLDGVNRVEFESPDVAGKVIDAGFTTARVRVTIDPNAESGQRYFRLFSRRGATNLLVFRLTRWPEFKEIPADGSLEKATPVSVPSLTSGILHADMSGMAAWGEEADLYRFHAHKGQRLRFTVFGVRNIGTRTGMPQTNADLSLTLLRADGRQVSWDEGRFVWDSYLDQTFPEEGDYIAAITVTRAPTTVVMVYPKYEPAFYQLAIGNAPQLWNVFPIGAQRGHEVELELRADFMPPNPKLILQSHGLEGTIQKTPDAGVYRLKLRSAPDASLGQHHITVRDDSGTTAPLRFVLGDLPENLESEPNDSREQAQLLNWPVTVNGRMDHKADSGLVPHRRQSRPEALPRHRGRTNRWLHDGCDAHPGRCQRQGTEIRRRRSARTDSSSCAIPSSPGPSPRPAATTSKSRMPTGSSGRIRSTASPCASRVPISSWCCPPITSVSSIRPIASACRRAVRSSSR